MAGRWFVNEPDRSGGRYIILATDGVTIDTDKYLEFYDQYMDKATVGDVAGFVLEPIQ